jgi:hypothetical protein
VALTLDWDGIITQFETLLRSTIASHKLHALPPSPQAQGPALAAQAAHQ